jgi:hypothetical protein
MFHDRCHFIGRVAVGALDHYRFVLREAGKKVQSVRLEEISAELQESDEQKVFG